MTDGPANRRKLDREAGTVVGVPPAAQKWHEALVDVLSLPESIGSGGKTTKERWYAEGVRRNLAQAVPEDVTGRQRDAITKNFKKHVTRLVEAGWIGADGETVTNLRR